MYNKELIVKFESPDEIIDIYGNVLITKEINYTMNNYDLRTKVYKIMQKIVKVYGVLIWLLIIPMIILLYYSS